MDDHDKIIITSDELFDSRVDEELVRKESIILSQKVEKVEHFSKFDNRILIQIGVFFLCILLIALTIIWFGMKHQHQRPHQHQEQPSVKTKIYKAGIYPQSKEHFISQTKLLTVTVE
jgi:hypothetical protein